jgi:hypothetical protein
MTYYWSAGIKGNLQHEIITNTDKFGWNRKNIEALQHIKK